MRSVYFVQASIGGPIKVGSTGNIARRIICLQIGSAFPLRVLGVVPDCGNLLEFELHRTFEAARTHGEWFLPVPELLQYIADHSRPFTFAPLANSADGFYEGQRDGEGVPNFISIVTTNADGKEERKYLHERRMKPIHYRQFYDQCEGREGYWHNLKMATAKRCVDRHGVEGQMLFPGWNDAA